MSFAWSRSIPNRNTRGYDTQPVQFGQSLTVPGSGQFQVISHPFKGKPANQYQPGLDWQLGRTASAWCLPLPYADSSQVIRWAASSVAADGGTYNGQPLPLPYTPPNVPQILSTYGVGIELQQVFLGAESGSIDFKLWDGAPVPGQIISAAPGPLGMMAMGSANTTIAGTVSEDSGIQFCNFSTGGPSPISGAFPFTPLGSETYVDGDTVVCAFINNEYRSLGGTCSET